MIIMEPYNKRRDVRSGSMAPWIYFVGEEQRQWNPASGEPMPKELRMKPFELPKGVRVGSSAKWVEAIPYRN